MIPLIAPGRYKTIRMKLFRNTFLYSTYAVMMGIGMVKKETKKNFVVFRSANERLASFAVVNSSHAAVKFWSVNSLVS